MSIKNAIDYELRNDPDILALVGNQVYAAGEVPQNTTGQYVVWQRISGMPSHHISGVSSNGMTELRLQISCYGDTEADAAEVADTIRAFLDYKRGTIGDVGETVTLKVASLQNETDDTDPPIDASARGRFKTVQDYLVVYT